MFNTGEVCIGPTECVGLSSAEEQRGRQYGSRRLEAAVERIAGASGLLTVPNNRDG